MKNPQRLIPLTVVAVNLALVLLPSLAYAHVGHGPAAGLARGISHPLGGIDHLLSMIAVGLWAAQGGTRERWLIPAAFVLFMMAGALLGTTGALPLVENGVILSVLVLGVLVAAAIRLPLLASALLVGLFALLHGHAHGAEMPATVSGLAYGAGFVLTTIALHALGMVIGLSRRALGRMDSARVSGGLIAASGIYMWFAG